MGIQTIELVETQLGQPQVIATRPNGAPWWSSIDRQRTSQPELYLTWTGLAGDQPTDTRPKYMPDEGVVQDWPPGNPPAADAEARKLGQLHGGNDKAVYAYPIEHYLRWLTQLGQEAMEQRSFGENWRLVGVTEADVHIGDIWEIGEAKLEVSRVRTPCKTLEAYFGGQPMIKHMAANGLCGWYLRVRQPGIVPTQGSIRVVKQNKANPTVAEAFSAKMPGRT